MPTKIKPYGIDSTQDFTFDDITANSVTISKGLTANGSLGTSGQVLTSNGSVVYWGAQSATGGETISSFLLMGG